MFIFRQNILMLIRLLGSLHRVEGGSVADFSQVQSAFIFGVEASKMEEFSCNTGLQPTDWRRVGIGTRSTLVGTVDRKHLDRNLGILILTSITSYLKM
jgi:hypothetical protein